MDLITSAAKPIVDSEWRGDIAKATTSSSADFRLLVSMLQQNVMKRPSIHSNTDSQEDSRAITLSQLPAYPHHPLSATSAHYDQATVTNELIHQGDLTSIRLNFAMAPPPLSRFNDAHRIDDEVVANSNIECQTQLAESQGSHSQNEIESANAESHEPLLFDMLEALGKKPMLDDLSTQF